MPRHLQHGAARRRSRHRRGKPLEDVHHARAKFIDVVVDLALRAASMTGPTSVASVHGIAHGQFIHRALEHLERSARRPLPARRAGAEPSSAGRRDWKAEARMSRTACSGSAVESTIMALSAAGLGDQRRVGGEVLGHGAVDGLAPWAASR